MSDKQPYFSLAISKEAKQILDELTTESKLSQSEVIECLLDISGIQALSHVLQANFKHKREAKLERRAAKLEQKSKLRDAISKMPTDELESILREKGLLAS